jgi:hypothetical protein
MNMREIKIRYTFRHVSSGEIVMKSYTLSQLETWESNEISPYFMSGYGYELIGRDEYTGLKDKNGKEIYEGDIVENPFSKAREFCYKVIWYEENGQWCFDPFMKGDQDAPLLGIEEFVQEWETVQSGIEVIGNIYENPELLNIK